MYTRVKSFINEILLFYVLTFDRCIVVTMNFIPVSSSISRMMGKMARKDWIPYFSPILLGGLKDGKVGQGKISCYLVFIIVVSYNGKMGCSAALAN